MNDFLEKVHENKKCLREWMFAAVCQMDKIVDDGFPRIFGENWRIKMSDFSTPARTKLLTYIFDRALEITATENRVEYRATGDCEQQQTVSYDCRLFGRTVLNKLSLGADAFSFATGNRYGAAAKRILAVKLQCSSDWKFHGVFAALIDLNNVQSDNTKWHFGNSEKAAFSNLKISSRDREVVVPVCGNIAPPSARGSKYIKSAPEIFEPR